MPTTNINVSVPEVLYLRTITSGQVTEGEVLSQVASVWSNSTGNVTIEVISDDFTTDPSPIIVPALGLTTPIIVSIASKEDFIAQGDRTVTVSIQVSSSTGLNIPSSSFSVTIADDDTAGVIITESGGSTFVTEAGTTDTYTVVLTSQPTANVTVNLDGGAQLSLSSTAVTFTPQNWNVPQTVTVSAVDDAFVEGTHTQTINHTATSTDAKYNGISISSITANITDNDRNDAPSFTPGSNQTVAEDSGAQTVANWATNISPGPADEASQIVNFQVTNDNNELFSVQPAIDSAGNLTYTPAINANGSAIVTAILQDDGGTVNGGVDSSNPQTFTITINPVNDIATISGIVIGVVTEDLNVVNGNLTATGNLSITDADIGEDQFNTTVTSATDTLGSLSITAAGAWNYSVANSAVQFLGAGATKTETFSVQSADGTASLDIAITITGVNDTASITGTATGAVTEDTSTPNLTATGTLTVADVDTGDNTFNTNVTSATGNLGSLNITDTGTWNYSVANSAVQFLGAGVTKTEIFSVESVDGTVLQDIAITINGNNDAPTDLFLSKSDIDEQSPALTTIGLFSTIDIDVNDSFTYSLIDGDGADDNDVFTIDGNELKIKTSPDFEIKQSYKIRVKTTDTGGLSYQKALAIAVNDLDIPSRLTTKDDDIFNITSDDTKITLQVTLLGRNSNQINELGVFIVDDATGTINGIAPGADGYAEAALERAQVIFSAITNVPNDFNPSDLTRSLELNSGANLRFYLVKNNSTTDAILPGIQPITDVLFASTATLKVTDLGNDQFRLAWEDGTGNSTNDFQDLVVKIQSSNQNLPLGTKLQGRSQGEVIDLRSVTTPVTVNFNVYREAAFDNFVGFYRITDEKGGIDINSDGNADILPGEAGYAQAAVRQRVAGIDLAVSNQGTATSTGSFTGGDIFAPFLIVNSRPDAVVDNNPNNDPKVYFAFLGANSDKRDHIRLLGDNIFAFEDLSGGGDGDFNDMIVKFALS
ncbi:MAG: VCBS domain-containing protein [Nostoc sp. ZfuVER08]|nr:VCBS domain-containing protein [Nostoc sp. ZfuVER08]